MNNDVRFVHSAITSRKGKSDRLVVEGFVSTETKDRHRTRILAEGFDVEAFRRNPTGYFDHGWDPNIGFTPVVRYEPDSIEVREGDDGRGLYMRGEVYNDTPEQQRVEAFVKQGSVRFFSVGFIPRSSEWERNEGEDPVEVITEAELVEASLVTIPSNREAEMSIARALRFGSDLTCDSCQDRARLVGFPNVDAACTALEAHVEDIVSRGDAHVIQLAHERLIKAANALNPSTGEEGLDPVVRAYIVEELSRKLAAGVE